MPFYFFQVLINCRVATNRPRKIKRLLNFSLSAMHFIHYNATISLSANALGLSPRFLDWKLLIRQSWATLIDHIVMGDIKMIRVVTDKRLCAVTVSVESRREFNIYRVVYSFVNGKWYIHAFIFHLNIKFVDK